MTTTITEIATELKMSPKVARAILRREKMKPSKDGWVFENAAEKNKIIKLLSDAPKPTPKKKIINVKA